MDPLFNGDSKIDVYPLLLKLFELGGSDMFFSVGTPPGEDRRTHACPAAARAEGR